MEKEVITLKGDRDLWMEFTIRLRREKKEVWEVIKPWIKNFLNKK